MKKILIMAAGATLLLSSCGSYTGAGAYTGAQFGSILGSAIGGISNGPRGSDVGTIIGMAGGAIVGGAIGNAADQKARGDMAEHREAVKQHRAHRNQQQYQYEQPSISGFDANSGYDANNTADDRIDFDGTDTTYSSEVQQSSADYEARQENGFHIEPASEFSHVELRNAHFVVANGDNVISRGETCQLVFEVMNTGKSALYDVVPTVAEMSGNKHIFISPSVRIEKISAGKGIRYTAMIKADNRLKEGTIKICCSVIQGDKTISEVSEFNIETRK